MVVNLSVCIIRYISRVNPLRVNPDNFGLTFQFAIVRPLYVSKNLESAPLTGAP